MNCNDCDYKQNNPDGGFCYMFFEHFKIRLDSGPLDICMKFKYSMNKTEETSLIEKAIENGNPIIR